MDFVKYDLGNVKQGSTVSVILKNAANVQLLDESNFRSYSQGRRYSGYGGYAKRSPVLLPVPRTSHWYVALDLGGHAGKIQSSVKVLPPPRGALPEYRNPSQRSLIENIATRQPESPPDTEILGGRTWDVFLSHASEDKASVAVPLAQALQDRGVTVWLDTAQMKIGQSLRRRIDQGIASSTFAAVVFSEPYFSKGWTQYELDGIVTMTVDGKQNILPIWHGVGQAEVAAHSPSLADKLARSTTDFEIAEIADEIAELVQAE